ncbi:MAG: oligosaccharide flippase family protein [Clostridia bacterium]|nr:oligosaccharide flippase family protein [Clostridia bacterium]
MQNRKKFFYNGVIMTLVALLLRSVAMFFSAYFSRTVGEVGVGLYTVIMTVYSFLLTLATSGISLTVTRHVASALGRGERGELCKIMRGAFLYSLLFGTLASLVLFFGADLIADKILNDGRVGMSLRVLSFSLLPSALCSALSGYFVGVKKIASNSALQLIGGVLRIPITVFAVSKFAHMGVEYAVFGICLGIFLSELLSFLMIYTVYLVTKERGGRGAQLGKVAKTALPLAFSTYVRSALLTLEHVLIPKKLTERGDGRDTALASYGALHGMSLPLIMYPMTPLTSFSGLLVPEFAEAEAGGEHSRLSRICTEAVETTLKYAVCVAVLIYVFAEELGYTVYSSYEAGRYIALLAPAVPIMYLDHITDGMLKGVGEQVYAMWVNITDSLLSVILVVILIPKMGIVGYGLVIIIMEAYNFALSYLRLKKRIKFSIRPLRAIILPLISALLSAFFVKRAFSVNGALTSPLWLILKIIFAAAVFIALNTAFSWLKSKRTKITERLR